MGSDRQYPKPPWRTEGHGLIVPCVVPVKNVPLPEGFEAVHTAGRSLGLLVYLKYDASSPLHYSELMWLPTMVRCTDRRYRVPGHFGPLYYVARMYVDSAQSLEAGRSEWALPKTLAAFNRVGNSIEVDADDGTRLAFSFRPRGFTFTAPSTVSTLQKGMGRVVAFQAKGRAQMQLATYTMDGFSSEHPEWESFKRAFVLPGLASHLKAFKTTMHPAHTVLPRFESFAPIPLAGM